MANAMNNLVATQSKQPFTVAIQSQGIQRMLQASLSTPQAITKFTADLMAAVTATPGLKDCDPASIVSAGLQCSALNLSTSPSVGEAYLVPYGNKCTFQIGKNGLVQLAIRSGQYLDIGTIEIHAGEYKGRDRFTGKPQFEFVEDDDERENLPVVGYLAYFEMLNGFRKVVYFSHEKMLKWAARYSPAFDANVYRKYENSGYTGNGMTQEEVRKCSGVWYQNFGAMAEKTVLRQLLQKWGVKSRDMVQALEQDMKTDTEQQFFETAAQPVVVESEPAEPVQKATKARKQPAPQPQADAEEDFFN